MQNSTSSAILEILLKNQSDSYSFLLNVLTGGILLLIATQWLWNLYYKRSQIKADVKIETDKIKEDVLKVLQDDLKVETQKLEQKLNLKYVDLEADLNRNFGINAENDGFYVRSSEWWLAALETYILRDIGEYITISLGALKRVFQHKEWSKQNTKEFMGNDLFDFDYAKKVIGKVPNTLKGDKEELLNMLEILQKPLNKTT